MRRRGWPRRHSWPRWGRRWRRRKLIIAAISTVALGKVRGHVCAGEPFEVRTARIPPAVVRAVCMVWWQREAGS